MADDERVTTPWHWINACTVVVTVIIAACAATWSSLLYNWASLVTIQYGAYNVDVSLLPLMAAGALAVTTLSIAVYAVAATGLAVFSQLYTDAISVWADIFSRARSGHLVTKLLVVNAIAGGLLAVIVQANRVASTGFPTNYSGASFLMLSILAVCTGLSSAYSSHRIFVASHDPDEAKRDSRGFVASVFRFFNLIPAPYSGFLVFPVGIVLGILYVSLVILLEANWASGGSLSVMAGTVALLLMVTGWAWWIIKWSEKHTKRGTHRYWVTGRYDYMRPSLSPTE